MKCRAWPPPKPWTQEREQCLPKNHPIASLWQNLNHFISPVSKKSGKFTFQPSNPCNVTEVLQRTDMDSGCQQEISGAWSGLGYFCALRSHQQCASCVLHTNTLQPIFIPADMELVQRQSSNDIKKYESVVILYELYPIELQDKLHRYLLSNHSRKS